MLQRVRLRALKARHQCARNAVSDRGLHGIDLPWPAMSARDTPLTVGYTTRSYRLLTDGIHPDWHTCTLKHLFG